MPTKVGGWAVDKVAKLPNGEEPTPYIFSFFIWYNEKGGKEMGLVLFVTWLVFAWAYMSEADKYDEE